MMLLNPEEKNLTKFVSSHTIQYEILHITTFRYNSVFLIKEQEMIQQLLILPGILIVILL
jgi:hypothetical protein